jgi:hypothetical protein
VAAAATGGVAALAVLGAPLAVTAIAVVPAGYLVRDWFMFRAKRGMRF